MGSKIQKHIELITQYSSIQAKSNVYYVNQHDGDFGSTDDYMPEPASDDAAGRSLFAVYQRGFQVC